MIGGGTWEGAPMPGIKRREFISLVGGAVEFVNRKNARLRR
jgi:hypothetical protein